MADPLPPSPSPSPSHSHSQPPTPDATATASGAPAPRRTGSDEAIPMLTEIVQVPRYVPEELPRTLEEVDWSGLTERVRLTPMGREVLARWPGEIPRAGLRERIHENFRRHRPRF